MLRLLSATERLSAERLRLCGARERWLRCRAALRTILAWHSGHEIWEVAIHEGKDTKPTLNGNPAGLHFNISHSDDYAVVALGGAPLGVDIEAVDETFCWQAIARDGLIHPRERQMLTAVPAADQAAALFQIWTLKEAYLKGLGTGSLDDMASLCVSPDGCLLGEPPRQWRVMPLHAPTGYRAALASASHSPIVIDRTHSLPQLLERAL